MRIIFSKDRPAQLDLLLRSLERYAPNADPIQVLWCATDPEYEEAYRSFVESADTPPENFNEDLRWLLPYAGETVTFFCDDDVVFRPIPDDPRAALADSWVLCHSWRLSAPARMWRWADLPRSDHGYPGSIDGHTFRTSDVQEMIGSEVIANPTMLETVLALGCEKLAERRPLMAAWPEQVLVGVPVNRVSEQSGCPNGERYPQPVEELNRRFLSGERISLDRLDFTGVTGCHHELQYEWE